VDVWTDAKKSSKKMMKASWSQITLTVQGHTLKRVMKVKSLNPKEAWDRLKEEYEPSGMVDVVDLQKDFSDLVFPSIKKNPVNWIEDLDGINTRCD
jgi:hypothetical protein